MKVLVVYIIIALLCIYIIKKTTFVCPGEELVYVMEKDGTTRIDEKTGRANAKCKYLSTKLYPKVEKICTFNNCNKKCPRAEEIVGFIGSQRIDPAKLINVTRVLCNGVEAGGKTDELVNILRPFPKSLPKHDMAINILSINPCVDKTNCILLSVVIKYVFSTSDESSFIASACSAELRERYKEHLRLLGLLRIHAVCISDLKNGEKKTFEFETPETSYRESGYNYSGYICYKALVPGNAEYYGQKDVTLEIIYDDIENLIDKS